MMMNHFYGYVCIRSETLFANIRSALTPLLGVYRKMIFMLIVSFLRKLKCYAYDVFNFKYNKYSSKFKNRAVLN